MSGCSRALQYSVHDAVMVEWRLRTTSVRGANQCHYRTMLYESRCGRLIDGVVWSW